MMPFMPSPEEFAEMQRQAASLQRAETVANIRLNLQMRRHAWLMCMCSMYASSRVEYWNAIANCPVHSAFIITTEELLKEVRSEPHPYKAA